jgi:hypothetical protein
VREEALKTTIEQLVDVERFNMRKLCTAAWPLVEQHDLTRVHLQTLKDATGSHFGSLCNIILRYAFLIELVKVPKIESTKFRVRWYKQLKNDPRECSFDECLAIAAELLTDLGPWLDVKSHRDLFNLSIEESLFAYDAPIDYRQVPSQDDNVTRIHRLGNIGWTYDDMMLRTLKLRRFLCDPQTSPDAEFFKRVLDGKIKVKTYLTDRALTGLYKTNREKRWETHPHSVQFATYRTTMEIEYVLIRQLCAFEGFPPSARETLQQEGILPDELPIFRCPVTQEPMSFPTFRDALMNPQHGKSSFQVGHLNPLKVDEPGNDVFGHTADNISWISEDGNRIQGPLSLTNVRQLLRKIAANYEELHLV